MTSEPTRQEPVPDPRVRKCRSCGAEIIFLPTPSGKQCPANANTVNAGDETFVWGHHVSHFATCTDPEKHRKTR